MGSFRTAAEPVIGVEGPCFFYGMTAADARANEGAGP
jgi:hypothetical protein